MKYRLMLKDNWESVFTKENPKTLEEILEFISDPLDKIWPNWRLVESVSK